MFLRSAALTALLIAAPVVARAAGGEAADQPRAPASNLNMAMTLYAAGITLGKVDLDATIQGGKYRAVSNLETAGIVNAFWQSKIQATSSGDIGQGRLEPSLYDSFYTGRANHKQEVSLTYEENGAIRLYSEPAYSTTKYPVSDAEKKGTFDPLSAIVYVATGVGADAANPCGVVAPVFDGRRRYNIEIVKDKDVQVSMDNGLYKGPAVLCRARYNQIAGFSQHMMDDSADFPAIHAWVATFASNTTGRRYVVPLRVWADTPYGVVAAVTHSLKIDGVNRGMNGG